MKITSKAYDDRMMVLILDDDTGKCVLKGEKHGTGRGEAFQVKGGTAPHKPSSTGKVWGYTEDGMCREYYPGVINAKWVTLYSHKEDDGK